MSQNEEFPKLTKLTQAAHRAGCLAGQFSAIPPTCNDRRYLSAFLVEAMKQSGVPLKLQFTDGSITSKLFAIANNLHSPPTQPPLPTLAEAREADLDTPAGRDVVREFLATLGEGVQP